MPQFFLGDTGNLRKVGVFRENAAGKRVVKNIVKRSRKLARLQRAILCHRGQSRQAFLPAFDLHTQKVVPLWQIVAFGKRIRGERL